KFANENKNDWDDFLPSTLFRNATLLIEFQVQMSDMQNVTLDEQEDLINCI
ncbi:14287_t:CDS:2, partial [Funneliformis caledonium]